MSLMHKIAPLAAISALVASLAVVTAIAPAVAAPLTRGPLVSADPTNRTPHVLDGRVLSIVQVGDDMILGGLFTSASNDVRNDPTTTAVPRSNLVAFDAASGVIRQGFKPDTNGTVNVVLPAGDGETIYVGGSFTQIAGQAVKNLARIRVSDGSLVTSFNGGSPAGQVKDLRVSDGRLWVAGSFTHIAGKKQLALATLNAQTGAFDSFARPLIAGVHKSGYTTVAKIDINPSGTRLIAVGNFDTVDGVKNHQFFMLDVAGSAAAPSTFRTNFYITACSKSFDSYMRDLDFSPDGSFFVISTTGAYGGADTACDSTARFETGAAGAEVRPSWIDNTGGDTTYAVEITDAVVYTGGHARWQNNPFAGDRPGAGAVSRPGIAALDPSNGLPYSWNPTRDRGVGVFDLLSTSQGLWVGSDTERIGESEYHGRIAMFPTAGGTAIPLTATPQLSNSLYRVTTSGEIDKRTVTSNGIAPAQATSLGDATWTGNRGGFMLNGQLYSGAANGEFTRRSFDGTTFGPPVQVNTGDQLTNMSDWDTDVSKATGMFYDNGRVYYTRSDANALYYRYLTVESDVVGARRYQVSSFSGMDLRTVRGLFLAGDTLFVADSSGNLARWDWADGPQYGAPVNGTKVVVSGPQSDGVNWSTSRSLFLYQDDDGVGEEFPPVATLDAQCVANTCTFDASGSTAPGSRITSYAWDFGDQQTGDGESPQHAYGATGDYVVSVTVTTERGATATATRTVHVVRANVAPSAKFTVNCAELVCDLDSSGSSDSDGEIADVSWNFGDGETSTELAPNHVFAEDGTFHVTLNVTDDQGAAGSTEQDVTVQVAAVSVVGFASSNANRSTHATAVPNMVTAGDRLVAILTLNSSTTTTTAPDGWENLDTVATDGLVVSTWTRTATASDFGQPVRFVTSSTVKSDLSVAAYRSTTGSAVVSDVISRENPRQATQFDAGPLQVTKSGSLVSYYWGVKTSSDVGLQAAEGLTNRITSTGSGSGRIAAILADSGSVSPAGDNVSGVATSTAGATRAASVAMIIAPE